MLPGPRFTLLILSAALLGCGSVIHPYSDQIQILPSPLIATGAWTIYGQTAAGDYASPIGGFLGALTVTGNSVQAGLSIASTDSTGSPLPAKCVGNTFGLTATGTIANGTLTLDGDFPNNHVHISGQISPNGQLLTSGSYTVTGSCATTAVNIVAFWNAPLTGTYMGQLNSVSGANPQVTATLTQASYYQGYGYIPVGGTILFTAAGCTTSAQLQGAYVLGEEGILVGYTSSATSLNGTRANNFLLTGFDNPPSTTISNLDWGYPDSGCGAQLGTSINTGTLVHQ